MHHIFGCSTLRRGLVEISKCSLWLLESLIMERVSGKIEGIWLFLSHQVKTLKLKNYQGDKTIELEVSIMILFWYDDLNSSLTCKHFWIDSHMTCKLIAQNLYKACTRHNTFCCLTNFRKTCWKPYLSKFMKSTTI